MIPRPPRSRTTADFVVQLFAVLVALLMVGILVGSIVIEAINPDADTAPLLQAEAELMKLIIAALVGYLAGRPKT